MNVPERIRLFQVDALTSRIFGGNPAAICPLAQWLPDSVLQSIALENQLSETAFFVSEGDEFHLRWFTPTVEVDLCGHATLAAAQVLFTELHHESEEISFRTRSGTLTVRMAGDRLSMDFPAAELHREKEVPEALRSGLPGVELVEVWQGPDWLVRLEGASEIAALQPDFRALSQLSGRGVIVTAEGDSSDFVSRFFAPNFGIDEDPVTGSAHCALAPYWAERLGKTKLFGIQASARRGEVWCEVALPRVRLEGHAVVVLRGEFDLSTEGREF